MAKIPNILAPRPEAVPSLLLDGEPRELHFRVPRRYRVRCSHDGCSELGIWPFTDEQRAFIDHFGDHIEKRALPCFGNLALVPCPLGRKSTCEERYIMISIN